MSSPAVKDEDSDIDVPEDEGSGSDMEECHPFKPRPARNSFLAGLVVLHNTYVTQSSQGRHVLTAALDLRAKSKLKDNTWRH